MTVPNQAAPGVAQPPVPEQAAKPEPLSKRMEKSVTEAWQASAAKESAAAPKPAAEEAPSAQPAGGEQKAAEVAPAAPADDPFSNEQIADPKFWAGLDKAGWEKAARLHPVETTRIKAAFAAGTRIVNEAKKQSVQPPAATTNEQPPAQPAISDDLLAAVRRANSLDERESGQGLKDIVKLVLKDSLPEFGIDPKEGKSRNIGRTAYAMVVADLPEVSTLDGKELDDVVESDATLTQLIETAETLPDEPRTRIVASVMRQAAERVLAKKKADADSTAARTAAENKKKAEEQKRARSNVSIASNAVVESPSGGAPQQKKPIAEFIIQKWNEEAARESGGG